MNDSRPPAQPTDQALASLAVIEQAAASLVRGDTDRGQIAAAADAARRLASSSAAREAGEIETLLGSPELDDAAVYRLTVLVEAARTAISKPRAAAEPEKKQAADEERIRIVAVDDDPVILALLTHSLPAHGIDVVAVPRSSLAVQTITRERPDLAIIDVDMPDPNGLEVCRGLRANPETADLPIICFTSHTERQTIAALFEAGIDDHIEKPAAPSEIAMRVRNRLARVRRPRPAATSSVTPVPETSSPANVPRYDVVVVDDDRVMTAVLGHMLVSRGYSMEIIADGATAVERLAGPSPSITARAILLDVSLPGLDGMAVLRAFARSGLTRRSRVIMLTARSLESEVVQALDLGACDHIAKPFSIPVLMQRLRVALESAPA